MFDQPPNTLLPDFPDDPPYPVFIARPGVTLNIDLVRKLELDWGLRPDGTFIMTHAHWSKAAIQGAVLPPAAVAELLAPTS